MLLETQISMHSGKYGCSSLSYKCLNAWMLEWIPISSEKLVGSLWSYTHDLRISFALQLHSLVTDDCHNENCVQIF